MDDQPAFPDLAAQGRFLESQQGPEAVHAKDGPRLDDVDNRRRGVGWQGLVDLAARHGTPSPRVPLLPTRPAEYNPQPSDRGDEAGHSPDAGEGRRGCPRLD